MFKTYGNFAETLQEGLMNFFENFTQLRQNPTDVTYFPHRQLASKVFGMVEQTYMTGTGDSDPFGYVTLRPDVSPEMLEACFSRIFGKTLMTEVIKRLPILAEQFKDCDEDDLYMPFLKQRNLLGEIAKQSAWGSPATEDVDELSFLVYSLVGGSAYMQRFVDQTTKRLATVH